MAFYKVLRAKCWYSGMVLVKYEKFLKKLKKTVSFTAPCAPIYIVKALDGE